jgi:hypothetical protein
MRIHGRTALTGLPLALAVPLIPVLACFTSGQPLRTAHDCTSASCQAAPARQPGVRARSRVTRPRAAGHRDIRGRSMTRYQETRITPEFIIGITGEYAHSGAMRATGISRFLIPPGTAVPGRAEVTYTVAVCAAHSPGEPAVTRTCPDPVHVPGSHPPQRRDIR